MKLPVQIEEKRHIHVPVKVLDPREIIEKRAEGELSIKEGLDALQKYLKQRFPLERVSQLIDDLAQASDTKLNQYGAKVVSPNWSARDKGLDKILKLLALTQDNGATAKMAPTKMVFNIISNSPVKVEQKEKTG